MNSWLRRLLVAVMLAAVLSPTARAETLKNELAIDAEVKAWCAEPWPSDYVMQLGCVRPLQQFIDAFPAGSEARLAASSAIPDIIRHCRSIWLPTIRCLERQLEAYRVLHGGSAQGDKEPPVVARKPSPIDGPLQRTITDAIRKKVEANWSVPAGIRDAGELEVELRIQLGPDSKVSSVKIIGDGHDASSNFRTMAESARRAVLKASPFEVLTRHSDNYYQWRDITMIFWPPA